LDRDNEVPLLDADLVPAQVRKDSSRGPFLLTFALLGAIGLVIAISLFVAPRQAKEVLQEIVQTAQALVKKEPAAKKSPQEESDDTPRTLSHRTRRDHSAHVPTPIAIDRELEPLTVRPATPQRRPLRSSDVPIGMPRPEMRELFGEPDLKLYKLEKDHIVEHFVYINGAQNHATSVMLIDGRVAWVYSGTPSVWNGKNATRPE
jgi:hypothetical protein